MSIKCQSWVYENSEARGNERLVLLAIADEANDDGTNAYPGIDTIAHKARVNKRTTMRCIDRLEQDGRLVVLRPEVRGRGHFNTYLVVMQESLALTNSDSLSPIEMHEMTDETVTERRVKARIGALPYLNGSRPIDPLTHRPEPTTDLRVPKKGDTRPTAKRQLPEDFTVTAEMREWAAANTPAVDIDAELAQFSDYHRSNANTKADWVSAWRTWMRNAKKWGAGSRSSWAPVDRTHRNPANTFHEREGGSRIIQRPKSRRNP